MRRIGRGARRFAGTLLLASALLGVARGEEPKPSGEVPGLAPAEGKARRARLDTRVGQWWNARKRLVHACAACGGRGLVRWGRGWRTCPTCDGRKRVLDPKVYRTLHYDMKTEAFRLLEDIRDRLEDRYEREKAGDWPIDVQRWKVERVLWCDAEHAEVFVVENRDSVSRPQRWTFVGKDWYVWDALSKEGWPGEAAPNASLPQAPRGAPLEPAQRAEVDAALGGVNQLHDLASAEASGTTLLLGFARKRGTSAGEARLAIAQEAVSVVRAIFAPKPAWTALHLSWATEWRDRLGQVEARPYALAFLDRATFDKVVWGNLAESERPLVLRWETKSYDGFVPWD
jgi:hypothetical protein